MTVFALHQLLANAAETRPDHTAVSYAGEALSYQELYRRSRSVAAALIDAGVSRGDRVALYLPKGLDAVTAIYATMSAGAAYVPIDPASPALRAATIVRDCRAAALVTTPGRARALLDAMEDRPFRLVILSGDEGDPAPGLASARLAEILRDTVDPKPVPVVDTDLAYLLYTSGTTGVPKGVMLTHRHALTFIGWCADTIGTSSEDRFSNHAPFHFDLSVFDLYLAAYGSATVCMVPEEWAYFGRDLARFIQRERISVWYSVPSALMLLTRAAREEDLFPSLRSVVFAGEVYPTKHLRALRSLVPNADLWNLYGPTETNVCTYHLVGDLPDDDETIPIGCACENTDVFAITDVGNLATVGEPGELYVRGSSVMNGYWGDPQRSAQVLVEDPRGNGMSGLVYRTGDLVRPRPDGGFDFLGRRDHQIKSRGYRVELGEVEAAMNADDRLEAAIAVAVPHEDWGSAILAVVIPRKGHETLAEIDVKRSVALRLPRHMVPARVDIRRSLPRTSTGKIDRRSVTDEVLARAWSWEGESTR